MPGFKLGKRPLLVVGAAAVLATAILCLGVVAAQSGTADLLDLTIEELANLTITSVSRVEESLRDAPAAVFVITCGPQKSLNAARIHGFWRQD
jgi:iron complex outermembrane receptor protein